MELNPLLLTLIGATLTGIALLVGIVATFAENRQVAKAVISVYVLLLVVSLVLLSFNIEKQVNVAGLAKWWSCFQAAAMVITLLIVVAEPFKESTQLFRVPRRKFEVPERLRKGPLRNPIEIKERRRSLRIPYTRRMLALYIVFYGAGGCGYLLYRMVQDGFY